MLKRFLADEWDKARAQKRGGGQVFCVDWASAETRFLQHPVEHLTPEKVFEQRWALTLLDRVLERLGEEFTALGRRERFEQLQPYLIGDKTDQTYAALAAAWQTTEAAIKMAVSRMRRRYRELFLEEIAQTVSSPEEIEAEVRHLRAVLASGTGPALPARKR